jgi:signal transduction histidine kinase
MNNLLDNALRFAPKGSTVKIKLQRNGDRVEWIVSDDGPGVPAALGDRIFERLVRSDDSRNRESGGAGIGLAVCRKILQSRGGTIELTRLPGSKGASFICSIPIS